MDCLSGGKMEASFQYSKGTYKKDGDKIFIRTCCFGTMCSSFKTKDGRFRLNIKKKIFMMRIVKDWNMSPREAVDRISLESLESFKVRMDGILGYLI